MYRWDFSISYFCSLSMFLSRRISSLVILRGPVESEPVESEVKSEKLDLTALELEQISEIS